MRITYTIKRMIIAGGTCGCIVVGIYALFLMRAIDAEPRLIVGISSEFPPFVFKDGNQLMGLDIDLVHTLAKRLALPIEFKDMPFSTLLPAAQLGHIHMIACGLTVHKQRADKILFTHDYMNQSSLAIVSLCSNPIERVTDLAGKKVVVNQGYAADFYISEFPHIEIMRLQTIAQGFLALKSGRVAAFITSMINLKPFFALNNADDFCVAPIPDNDEHIALAISRVYPELHELINHELQSMHNDGTLQGIKAKWGVQ